MIPKSVSASSLLVSELCMERWKVENFHRTPQASSEPANIGTSVHFALEMFVRAVYLDQTHTWENVKYLNQMYEIGYVQTFGTTNTDTDAYRDGAALVARWYDRNKEGLPNKVVSCEVKENFIIKPRPDLEIPFNFIWDRADQLDDDVFEVVDYKTLRAPVRPEDLKEKIQPRAYALAAQIKWPDAKRIWVTFDMLRYDPVGVVFTRDENADTYRYLKRATQRIIDIDEDDTEETLNSECKWCIKKASCETLLKANAAGTTHGMPIEILARRKLEVDSQITALKYAQDELDKAICREAEERDEFEFEVDGGLKVEITAYGRRQANSNAISNIVGPALTAKYGSFTLGNIDKMLKDEPLDPAIKRQVEAQISKRYGEPSAKVKAPTNFEE